MLSLGQFMLYMTMVSTIVTLFYIRSSDFIHLTVESCTLLSASPYFSHPVASGTVFLLSKSLTLKNLPHIHDTIQYLSFYIWIVSLSIMPSRPNYVVPSGRISFFLMVEFHYAME